VERRSLLVAIVVAALVAFGAAAYASKALSTQDKTFQASYPPYSVPPWAPPWAPWAHSYAASHWINAKVPYTKCPCYWAYKSHAWIWGHCWSHWHWYPEHPLRHPWIKRHHGPRLVLSNEFKNHVLEILMSDNRTAVLLKEGYKVAAIKPVIEGFVSGNGTVELRAVKAIVVMKKETGVTHGVAVAVVDLVHGKVVRLVGHENIAWGLGIHKKHGEGKEKTKA